MDQCNRNEKLIIQYYQWFATQRKVYCVESTRFSDRHFWYGGYDKALRGHA